MHPPIRNDSAAAEPRESGQEPASKANESSDLTALLAGAARVAVEQGTDLDSFVKAAWSAFVDASPGLREHLKAVKLAEELSKLRETGRMPLA